MKHPRTLAAAAAAVLLGGLVLGGCQPTLWVALQFVYDEVELPADRIRQDVAYVEGPNAHPEKHRLDLFLPKPSKEGWPTVIFVHGGGWTSGDKDLRVGYEDVYGNIGRFFAAHGIGAAIINYRLLPHVKWPAQIRDVARAAAFVHRHIGAYGGDPDALFLMGHSAGAQLAARVALDPQPLARQGLSTDIISGVISVSGAGLDLTDERTYELSDDPGYYARRFATRPDWKRAASPITYVSSGDPPFLILFAGGETRALQRQSRLLHAALRRAGVESKVVVVPGKSHERIVPTLSRDDRTAGPAMLRFIHRVHTPGGRFSSSIQGFGCLRAQVLSYSSKEWTNRGMSTRTP